MPEYSISENPVRDLIWVETNLDMRTVVQGRRNGKCNKNISGKILVYCKISRPLRD